jgi:4-aminobutyrate aminotransferase-like enzyme
MLDAAAEGLGENSQVVGGCPMDRLREIGNRHIQIGRVRGAGLSIGLELVCERPSGPEI